MVMGWGWQDYHDKSPSNVLKEANVTLIDSENCGTADTEGSTGPAQVFQVAPLTIYLWCISVSALWYTNNQI